MRRLLLILMIALLPVRGWASDVMTVASAAQQLNATELVANYAIQTRTGAVFDGYFEVKPASSMAWDCPWRAKDAGQVAQDGIDSVSDSPSNRFCNGCNTCQLCMALVTGYPMALVSATYLPQAVQQVATISFRSAERTPGLKPPIS